MRVTKLVREYVTKEVSKVYDEPIKNATKNYDEEKEMIENQFQAILDEANERAEAILSKYKGYELKYCNGKPFMRSGSLFNYDKWNDGQTKASELKQEKLNKIDDILITLELGGTKVELEEMIKNITINNK
jgi:hypothetical protein